MVIYIYQSNVFYIYRGSYWKGVHGVLSASRIQEIRLERNFLLKEIRQSFFLGKILPFKGHCLSSQIYENFNIVSLGADF